MQFFNTNRVPSFQAQSQLQFRGATARSVPQTQASPSFPSWQFQMPTVYNNTFQGWNGFAGGGSSFGSFGASNASSFGASNFPSFGAPSFPSFGGGASSLSQVFGNGVTGFAGGQNFGASSFSFGSGSFPTLPVSNSTDLGSIFASGVSGNAFGLGSGDGGLSAIRAQMFAIAGVDSSSQQAQDPLFNPFTAGLQQTQQKLIDLTFSPPPPQAPSPFPFDFLAGLQQLLTSFQAQ